jgi:hypothetical protein
MPDSALAFLAVTYVALVYGLAAHLLDRRR